MPRSDITVVRLGRGDADRARALNALFAEAFGDPVHYAPGRTDTATLDQRLSQSHMIVLVAEVAGAIVAGLVAYQLDKLEAPNSEIYIYDLAVDAALRRRGIATALIAEVQRIGAEAGASVVYVQADLADPPAIALYDKLGTREEVLHFDLPVQRVSG